MTGKRVQYPSLQEPVNTPIQAQDFFVSSWHRPLSEPVRVQKKMRPALVPSFKFDPFPIPPPDPRPEFRWWMQPSEPVRVQKPLPVGTHPSYWMDQEAKRELDIIRFFPPLSEPVRTKKRMDLGLQPFYFFDPFPLPAEADPSIFFRWFRPLSEPVRVKKDVSASRMPVWAIDPFQLTLPEATSLDKWYSPLSEPVRVEAPLPVGSFPFFWLNQLAKLEPDRMRWFYPFSEPVRVGKIALIYSPYILDPFPLPDDVGDPTQFRWFRPLSEPVRTKKPLPVGAYPVWEIDAFQLTLPERTQLDKWFFPFSEPVRTKKPLPIGALPFIFRPIAEIVPEIITVDKWYRPLEEPVRVQKTVPQSTLPGFVMSPEAKLEPDRIRWFAPWSEPVRVKKDVSASRMPFWEIDALQLTLPENITMDKWFAPLSVPPKIYFQKRSEAALIASGLYLQGPPVIITLGHLKGEFRLVVAIDGSHTLIAALDADTALRDDC